MENNGKGIFYGVIGVATLIVAIIGATFAFFSAQNQDNTTVKGTAASASLALTVEKLTEITTVEPEGGEGEATTTTNYGVMVPQLDAHINEAVTGSTEYGSCIDTNGNVACQVYKITVKNEGTATAKLAGSITLAAEADGAITNLKWAVKAEEADTFGEGNYAVSTTGANGVEGNDTLGATSLATDLQLEPEAEEDYYVVVWISEIDDPQENYDHGSFTGVVKFNSASGEGLTSTFVGQS